MEDGPEINKREIRCIGLARSGNHAILNWIMNQIDSSYLFLNCAEPKYNPFTTARPLDESGTTFQTNISSFSLHEEQSGKWGLKDYLIYSYEDSFLGPLKNYSLPDKRTKWVGASSWFKNILILRDPFNLFASRTKAGLIHGHYTHGARPISDGVLKRIYKQHAKEFLGKSKFLKPLLPINFNRWAVEKDYRRKITEELGLQFSDKGFKSVHSVAGGSSFDGINFSGAAHQMKVNDRWRKYASDEEFWKLFDEELVDLTVQIFGEIPPVTFFRKNVMVG